ncbi:MAG: CDP-alcohol phosphatidyltransferase family protein [Bdellovibrionota bacterium]
MHPNSLLTSHLLRSRSARWRAEYRESLKSAETEDKIDLLFYRPLGFACAKAAQCLGLSPTQVTLAGMLAGLAAGALFSLGESHFFLLAAALFLFSGVLDSADGQLARIAGRSSPLGLVLDGLCDNIVFIAVYVGCCLPLAARTGAWIWPIAVAAGACHSMQSSLLDFYLRDFLFFTGEPPRESYWNPSPNDARRSMREASTWGNRWLWRLRFSWLAQQHLFSTRDLRLRLSFRERSEGAAAESFRHLYHRVNLPLLHLWRPLGANVHTFGIILFAYLGRFDLYLFLVDLLALNALLVIASWRQQTVDDRLARAAGIG